MHGIAAPIGVAAGPRTGAGARVRRRCVRVVAVRRALPNLPQDHRHAAPVPVHRHATPLSGLRAHHHLLYI